MTDRWEPAFPIPALYDADGFLIRGEGMGMTLRDYFAASALSGIIASKLDEWRERDNRHRTYAQTAYEIADEMLKARGPKYDPIIDKGDE